MKLDHNVLKQLGQENAPPKKPTHDHQMGDAWGVPVYEAKHGDKEGMMISEKTFFKMTEIVEGFIRMGREYALQDTGSIPSVSKEVNDIMLNDKTEVSFQEIDELGFYHYKIKFRDRMIDFDIEPGLLPLYMHVIRDMMYRNGKNPNASPIIHAKKGSSPVMSINDAIKDFTDKFEKLQE